MYTSEIVTCWRWELFHILTTLACAITLPLWIGCLFAHANYFKSKSNCKKFNRLVHSSAHKSQYNLNIIYVFCSTMITNIQNSVEYSHISTEQPSSTNRCTTLANVIMDSKQNIPWKIITKWLKSYACHWLVSTTMINWSVSHPLPLNDI